jgi:hypothetical protein
MVITSNDPAHPITNVPVTVVFSQSAIDVTMTPVNPPIQIPAGGGTFQYRANMRNTTAQAQTFMGWTKWRNPLNVWVNLLGPFTLTLPGNANVTRQRNQNVAGSNPAGAYTLVGYAGPNATTIWDSSYFNFVKSPTDAGGEWVYNNDNWGESFAPYLVEAEPEIPAVFALAPAHPNPFNPATTLTYALPQAARVSLAVYDVQGRRVADLVQGMQEPGLHHVTFDASRMASGMYLVHFRAGDFNAVQKLLLVK